MACIARLNSILWKLTMRKGVTGSQIRPPEKNPVSLAGEPLRQSLDVDPQSLGGARAVAPELVEGPCRITSLHVADRHHAFVERRRQLGRASVRHALRQIARVYLRLATE